MFVFTVTFPPLRHFPAPTSGYCTPPSGAGSSPGAGGEEPGFREETGRLARAGMAGGWETALGLGLCLAALHRGGECSPWGPKST